MTNRRRVSVAFGLSLLVLGGCSGITDPQMFTTFDWGEVEVPEDVVTGVSTSVALGDLFILGQFNTPTRCYTLDGNFKRSGSKLTLRVKADTSNPPNCDVRLGGFRYTAALSNLKYGTYQLQVIHEITGGTGGEYTKTVVIK